MGSTYPKPVFVYSDEVGGRHKVSSGRDDEDGEAASQGGRGLNSMAGGCPMAVIRLHHHMTGRALSGWEASGRKGVPGL